MIEVAVRWRGKFQGSKADIVESFVIDTVSFIRIFDQLMYG